MSKGRPILGLFTAAYCLSLLLVTAEGYSPAYTVHAVAGSTPNIDGTITTGEWEDAFTVSFNYTVVCVKQDGENLYMAFNVSNNTEGPSDYVEIAIDMLDDGVSSAQNDYITFVVMRQGKLLEFLGTNGSLTPPTGGWNGAANSTIDYWQAEFNITYARIQITSGEPKTLGLILGSIDSGIVNGLWPPRDLSETSPSIWGNLISEENWIPEFFPTLFLSLFVMATLISVVIYKRKPRQTRRRSIDIVLVRQIPF